MAAGAEPVLAASPAGHRSGRALRFLMASSPARMFAVFAAIVAGLPAGSAACTPAVPPVIKSAQQQVSGGRVVIVDFVDFECPFCRGSHLALAPILRENAGRIVVLRKHVPLSFHPHALSAARASICAEAQDKEPEMADLLAVTPPPHLDDEGCAELASKLGLDLPRYLACVVAPSTEARIRKDATDFSAAKLESLPSMYIDDVLLEGEQSEATLRATVKKARRARGRLSGRKPGAERRERPSLPCAYGRQRSSAWQAVTPLLMFLSQASQQK